MATSLPQKVSPKPSLFERPGEQERHRRGSIGCEHRFRNVFWKDVVFALDEVTTNNEPLNSSRLGVPNTKLQGSHSSLLIFSGSIPYRYRTVALAASTQRCARHVDQPPSAAMTSPARAGCHPANRLGSTTRSTNTRFSLGSPESHTRPSRQFLAFPSLMRLISVRADAALIRGIGRLWRSWLAFRRM